MPTSSGNRQTYTFGFWWKNNSVGADSTVMPKETFHSAYQDAAESTSFGNSYGTDMPGGNIYFRSEHNNIAANYTSNQSFRDPSAWNHLIVAIDTSQDDAEDRIRYYTNGHFVEQDSGGNITHRLETHYNTQGIRNYFFTNGGNPDYDGAISDFFFVDGLQLTPDVFGFHKEGYGNISVGSTFSSSYQNGVWQPFSPRVVKANIERLGGFGENGYYLPFSSWQDVGADFHCTPDTILQLNDELPQPKAGVAVTTATFATPGIGYTDVVRDLKVSKNYSDLPFEGCVKFKGSSDTGTDDDALTLADSNDWNLSGDFTIECWFYPTSTPANGTYGAIISQWENGGGSDRNFGILWTTASNKTGVYGYLQTDAGQYDPKIADVNPETFTCRWHHVALVRSSNTLTLYLDGYAVDTDTVSGNAANSTCKLMIGAEDNGSGNPQYAFDGYISNVRLVNGTAVYTNNFDVPTSPLTAITNTKLLCCQATSGDGTAYDTAPGAITSVGGAYATNNEVTGGCVLAIAGITTSTNRANLVSNGTFLANTTGWTAVAGSFAWDLHGRAKVTRSGGSGLVGYTQVTTVSGQHYTLSAIVDSPGSRLDVRAYSDNGSTLIANLSGTAGSVIRDSVGFTATSTTSYIYVTVDNNSDFGYISDVVVKLEGQPLDLSSIIRSGGGGPAKIVTINNNAGIAYSSQSYYGSTLAFDGGNDSYSVPYNTGEGDDFKFGKEAYTVEGWVKLRTNNNGIVFASDDGSNERAWNFHMGNGSGTAGKCPTWGWSYDGSNMTWIEAPNNLIPANEWVHVAACRQGETTSLYTNGNCVGIKSESYQTLFTPAENIYLGCRQDGTSDLDGFLQDIRIYKGVAKYKGDFDCPKVFNPVGFDTSTFSRVNEDSATNNYPTLNHADLRIGDDDGDGNAATMLLNGNCTAINTDDYSGAPATVGVTTGKWYWEVRYDDTNSGNSPGNGVTGICTNKNGFSDMQGVSYEPQADRFVKGNAQFYDGSDNDDSNGVIVGCALDKNAGTLAFYRNGIFKRTVTGINTLTQGINGNNSQNPDTCVHMPDVWNYNDGSETQLTINFGNNPTFGGYVGISSFYTDGNGRGRFKYEVPSGFLSLHRENLPEPAILDPGEHFKPVIYEGDGLDCHQIRVGFQPDLIITAWRNAGDNRVVWDSVRGSNRFWYLNATNAEFTSSNGIKSVGPAGYTVGSWNNINDGSDDDYVAYCWKAGNKTIPNSEGSINTLISVNKTAGFSICGYTGTNSNGTLGHGLGKVPKFAIFKGRGDTGNGAVYHWRIGSTHVLRISTDDAKDDVNTAFADTDPTDKLFTLGTWAGTQINGCPMISYMWAEIEGFSKFDSYTGNGSLNGPFVYCGFKPAWIMYKQTGSGENWECFDSARDTRNPRVYGLKMNTTNAESDDLLGTTRRYGIDFLSNGFCIRSTATRVNASGKEYVFAAFAEAPFKYANAD